jgi:anion-transporting  ArsA/GET3 family ATPase
VLEFGPVSAAADPYDKQLLIVVGKGGVGRTTVAAALAAGLARRGRRTLLYQANAKEKLSQLFRGPRVGEELVQLRENLWAVNTNAGASLHEYGLMVLRFETIYRMVLENKVVKALLRAIPGLDDYSIVGKLWFHSTEERAPGVPRWDTIVFDAPATGHAAAMLRIPRVILDAVPEGPLTRDAVKVRALLEDPARTAAIMVTIAEEMPVAESIELAAKVRALDIPLAWLVVNQLYPDRFDPAHVPGRVLRAVAPSLPEDPGLAGAIQRARMIAARRELNETYLARLRALALPEVRLPLLFSATLGPDEIDRLGRMIEQQVGERTRLLGVAR